MPDVQEVFRMATQEVKPDPGALERQHRRQRRSARNRKIAALAVAAVIIAAIAIFASKAMDRGKEGSAPATVAPTGSAIDLHRGGTRWHRPIDAPWLRGHATPDVSPDGTMIAFAFEIGRSRRSPRCGLDGSGFRVLTNDPIVGGCGRAGLRTEASWRSSVLIRTAILRLMVMNADGTNVREIPGTQRRGLQSTRLVTRWIAHPVHILLRRASRSRHGSGHRWPNPLSTTDSSSRGRRCLVA